VRIGHSSTILPHISGKTDQIFMKISTKKVSFDKKVPIYFEVIQTESLDPYPDSG